MIIACHSFPRTPRLVCNKTIILFFLSVCLDLKENTLKKHFNFKGTLIRSLNVFQEISRLVAKTYKSKPGKLNQNDTNIIFSYLNLEKLNGAVYIFSLLITWMIH